MIITLAMYYGNHGNINITLYHHTSYCGNHGNINILYHHPTSYFGNHGNINITYHHTSYCGNHGNINITLYHHTSYYGNHGNDVRCTYSSGVCKCQQHHQSLLTSQISGSSRRMSSGQNPRCPLYPMEKHKNGS